MFDEIIYIDSNFGIANVKKSHPIVIFNNFRYWWRNVNKDSSIRYVCSESNCFASIRIKENKVIKIGGKHFHDPLTDSEILLLKATQELKKEVSSDISKNIRNCYNRTQKKLMESNVSQRAILTKFPSFKKLSSTLQKRAKKKHPQVASNEFCNLEIPREYTVTKLEKEFLRYDKKSETSRILIFVDDESLKILAESEQWFLDGSFKSSPIKLPQLFTIHALVKNHKESTTLQCVYVLTSDKDEEAFNEIFTEIKNLALEKNIILNPNLIMTDYLKASTNAIKFNFTNINLKGSSFHFRQAIFRNVVKLDLKQHYHKDDYKEFINLLGALSLIPEQFVEDGFRIIESFIPNDPKCARLYSYFEKKWLKNIDEDWNHFESSIDNELGIEHFHSNLNKLTNSKNLNILSFMNHLKIEQETATANYVRFKLGQTVKHKSRKDSDRVSKFEKVKSQYKETNEIKDYLLGLCEFIQYPYEYWFDSSNYINEIFEEDENNTEIKDEEIEINTEFELDSFSNENFDENENFEEY